MVESTTSVLPWLYANVISKLADWLGITFGDDPVPTYWPETVICSRLPLPS